jgi:hypothetical protein
MVENRMLRVPAKRPQNALGILTFGAIKQVGGKGSCDKCKSIYAAFGIPQKFVANAGIFFYGCGF